MTAATRTISRPTLEELVDRLIDAFIGDDTPTPPRSSLARGIHEARRLRRVGDLDGGLAVFAGLDSEGATDGEQRWAYAEFLGLARGRFPGEEALVYSPGVGRAAVLTPSDEGTLEVRAVLGMRWRPGKVVSQRSLRGLKPLARGGAS